MRLSLKKRKDGLTSYYALHCGYIDLFETDKHRLTRWHEGGTVYHVRLHNTETGKRVFWETFEKCEQSAKFFKKHKKELTQ